MSLPPLTEMQNRFINLLNLNELAMTAEEISQCEGFETLTPDLITQALTRLYRREITTRVGRTPPINGRQGHVLWALTPSYAKTLDGIIPEISDTSDVNYSDLAENIINWLIEADRPRSHGQISIRWGVKSDKALDKLIRDGQVFRVSKSHYVSTRVVAQYTNQTTDADVDDVDDTNISTKALNIIKNYGKPIRTSVLAKMLNVQQSDIYARLSYYQKMGKLTKSKLLGNFGNKTYWHSPDISPRIARKI